MHAVVARWQTDQERGRGSGPGGRRRRCALLISTMAAVAALFAGAPAAGASSEASHRHATTRGVIVWTHRADDGSE